MGCYWGKCTFCDISLDYIGLDNELLIAEDSLWSDRKEIIDTNRSKWGFHFGKMRLASSCIDRRDLAIEILRRGTDAFVDGRNIPIWK